MTDIHAGAINLFKEAAEAYMKTRIEQERVDAVERSILGQIEAMAKNVERATSFKATWLPNVFIGVVASFVFTVIVLVSAAIYLRDPSPIAIFKQSSTDAKAPPK